MSSNPFLLKSAAPYASKPAVKITPEPVELHADEFQVIHALLPYQTPAAQPIRTAMHENCKIDGKKLFVYRAETGWTTVDLKSKPDDPKTTAGPHAVL